MEQARTAASPGVGLTGLNPEAYLRDVLAPIAQPGWQSCCPGTGAPPNPPQLQPDRPLRLWPSVYTHLGVWICKVSLDGGSTTWGVALPGISIGVASLDGGSTTCGVAFPGISIGVASLDGGSTTWGVLLPGISIGVAALEGGNTTRGVAPLGVSVGGALKAIGAVSTLRAETVASVMASLFRSMVCASYVGTFAPTRLGRIDLGQPGGASPEPELAQTLGPAA